MRTRWTLLLVVLLLLVAALIAWAADKPAGYTADTKFMSPAGYARWLAMHPEAARRPRRPKAPLRRPPWPLMGL